MTYVDLTHLAVRGELSKMQPQSIKHTFMGFIDGPKAIKYYDASTWQVHVSQNFWFPAMVASQTKTNNSTTPVHSTVQSEGESVPQSHNGIDSEKDTHLSDSTESSKRKRTTDETLDNNIRKSQRQKNIHDYHLLDDPWADEPNEMSKMVSMTSTERIYAASSKPNTTPDNPKTLKEARQSLDWPDWEKAVQAELDQLNKMGTWELVDSPEGCTQIPNKWVLTKKYNKDGNLQKYKARLVTKGYFQQPGMDYTNMFSPVMHLKTI